MRLELGTEKQSNTQYGMRASAKTVQVHYQCVCGYNEVYTDIFFISWKDLAKKGIKRRKCKKSGEQFLSTVIESNICKGHPFDAPPAIGDRVIVPAWVIGFGKDHLGTITRSFKSFDGVVSYTVRYDEPNDDGEIYKMVKINHILKPFEAAPPH